MKGFAEGYGFFTSSASSFAGARMGADYVDAVEGEIKKLASALLKYQGVKTGVKALKGNVAEAFHTHTFNANAVAAGSSNRVFMDASNGYASVDISSNFGKDFGLKYYYDGVASAKQQAKSVFERFCEYRATNKDATFLDFLRERGYTDETVANDPIYLGQVRVIPKDQYEEAVAWLKMKIATESAKRPEQVARYQETLDNLTTKVSDSQGVESIALSREDAERLAALAKEGKLTLDDLKKLGVSTEEIIKYDYVLQQAVKAGATAAAISFVLKVAPVIVESINQLIKDGELDEGQFKKMGFAALSGGGEGFVRGSVAAGITTACKAGLWGSALKSINPTVIGAAVAVSMNTLKNSFSVAVGSMDGRELADSLARDLFISSFAIGGGTIGQMAIPVPVLGYLIGNFVGSVFGGLAHSATNSCFMSFCINSGFTMFGLVDQNYRLPEEVLDRVGVKVFEAKRFTHDKFAPRKFEVKKFDVKRFRANTFSITPIRRGAVGVFKVGYV